MSPNAYVAFNDRRLLCGYPGEAEHEEPIFTWTYSTFERHLGESVTPSMYNFMAGHVHQNISKQDLYEIEAGDYCDGHLEAEAVDAYFEQPLHVRITMHEQELVNLRADKRLSEARESAAIDAMLEENKPFDDTSPITHEYAEFMRGIISKARKNIQSLDSEIYEEEKWYGGHEEGASDLDTDENYDQMNE